MQARDPMPPLPGPVDLLPAPFDAFEISICVEYHDPSGGTFVERHGDKHDEEAIGAFATLYGHFPSGGVHAICDAAFNDDEIAEDGAVAYLERLAASLNPALPVDII